MTGWVLLAVYVAGFFITARIVFTHSDDGDGIDRLTAAITGVVWPVMLVLLALYGLAMLPTLGVKTRRERRAQARVAEQERLIERQKLAARIAELEAENERWQAGEP